MPRAVHLSLDRTHTHSTSKAAYVHSIWRASIGLRQNENVAPQSSSSSIPHASATPHAASPPFESQCPQSKCPLSADHTLLWLLPQPFASLRPFARPSLRAFSALQRFYPVAPLLAAIVAPALGKPCAVHCGNPA